MTERDPRPRNETLPQALRDWDPAERLGEPATDRIARERARLLDAAREREQARQVRSPRAGLRWAAAAAALTLTLVAVFATRTWNRQPEAITAAHPSPKSVRLQMTASNGVHVYWSVELAENTGEPR